MIKCLIFSEGFKMYFSKEQPHWCTNITLTVRMKDLSTGLWWCRLHFIDYPQLYSVSKVIHVRLITLQRYAKTLILLSGDILRKILPPILWGALHAIGQKQGQKMDGHLLDMILLSKFCLGSMLCMFWPIRMHFFDFYVRTQDSSKNSFSS